MDAQELYGSRLTSLSRTVTASGMYQPQFSDRDIELARRVREKQGIRNEEIYYLLT